MADGYERSLRAIGVRLTLARTALGRKQAEFARQARVSSSAYNQYEHGRKRPAVDQANRLCDAYQLTLDWIYRGDPRGLPEELRDRITAFRLGHMARTAEQPS